jgi:hypothetical protein
LRRPQVWNNAPREGVGEVPKEMGVTVTSNFYANLGHGLAVTGTPLPRRRWLGACGKVGSSRSPGPRFIVSSNRRAGALRLVRCSERAAVASVGLELGA